jgi:hypothetical protein
VAEPFKLELEFTHPYKLTRLFTKNGRSFFGRWQPFKVRIDGDEAEYVVREGQEGQLDLLAETEYGDRQLWRVIAHANLIDFPPEDILVGTKLIIPKLAHVNSALQRALARNANVNLDRVEA